jgi:flagellar hook assembly protein FlgD
VVASFDDTHLAEHRKNGDDEGHLHVKARPNPLNPRTELTFTLTLPGRVQVAVYDMQGRLVNKLLDEVRSAGPQSVTWDGSNARSARVASGVYFFRIRAPEGQVIQRVAVVK